MNHELDTHRVLARRHLPITLWGRCHHCLHCTEGEMEVFVAQGLTQVIRKLNKDGEDSEYVFFTSPAKLKYGEARATEWPFGMETSRQACLSEKLTCQVRSEYQEVSCTKPGAKSSMCKGPKAQISWHDGTPESRPVWLATKKKKKHRIRWLCRGQIRCKALYSQKKHVNVFYIGYAKKYKI